MTEQTGGMVRVAWGPGEEVIGPDFAAIGKLAGAMSATIADVGAVAKDGVNRDQNYKYMAAGDVEAAIGAAMSRHGLAFALSVESVHQERDPQAKRAYSQVDYRWVILCSDGGAMLTGRWVAESLDFGTADKGLNKCATAMAKYLKLKLFVVATADEADSDAGEKSEGEQRQWVGATAGATRQAPAQPKAEGNVPADVTAWIAQVRQTAARNANKTSDKLPGYQGAQHGNINQALLALGYEKAEADTMAHVLISVLWGRAHFEELTAPECFALMVNLTAKSGDAWALIPQAGKQIEAVVKAAEAGAFDAPEPPTEADATPF